MSADNYVYAKEISPGVFAVELRFSSSSYEDGKQGEIVATLEGERAVIEFEQGYGTEYGVQFDYMEVVDVEARLLADFKAARAALDAVYKRLHAHFDPLVDAALAEGRLKDADEIVMKRIPDSPCRFDNWRKFQRHGDA